MKQTAIQFQGLQQQGFGRSFARHLLGVSLHLQTGVMEALQQEHGHTALRIRFEPYISMAARGGARLSEIADTLSISRQAANQVADQIEAAGYMTRRADTSDGRAKRLVLTARGERVVADGGRQALRLERQLRGLAGKEAMIIAEATLQTLCTALHLLPVYQRENEGAPILASLLSPLSNYLNNQLMELTRAKGHPHLKPNFSQVLSGIGPEGGRIQRIARSRNVSKQAVSAIVVRLEELGYVERVADPLDARGHLLHFTNFGYQLITDAVACETELCRRLADIVGKRRFEQLRNMMSTLYQALHLDEDLSAEVSVDTSLLASDLVAKLGTRRARELAAQLLKHTEQGQ